MDREALERDEFKVQREFILGGQSGAASVPGSSSSIRRATRCRRVRSPYLQIGETKYGRPILDPASASRRRRSRRRQSTRSSRSTPRCARMSRWGRHRPSRLRRRRSRDHGQRRFAAGDPDLVKIGARWERPAAGGGAPPQIKIRVRKERGAPPSPQEETIQLVEPAAPETGAELQLQASQRQPEPAPSI